MIVLSMCVALGLETHCHMKKIICLALHHPESCNIFVSRVDYDNVQNVTSWYDVCPSGISSDDGVTWWKWINASLFTIEMLVRVSAEQRDFYANVNLMRWWNILDTCLWVISVVDLVLDDPRVQVLRVGRLVRAMRLFELFPDLRAMFWSCFACAQSLLWAFFLLASFMYMTAIYLMDVAMYYLGHNKDLLKEEYIKGLASHWNGIYISMMSLVYSITGGLDWQAVADPFFHMGSWGDFHGLVFTSFIIMSTVGLLNILVGVFVQKANDVGSVSRDAAIAQAYLKRMDNKRDIVEVFEEFDKDSNWQITPFEIERGLNQPRIQAYFDHLDIDVVDKEFFLEHFHDIDDGCVSKDEFVRGCLVLQGASRPLREMKRLLDEIKGLKELNKQQVH